MYENCVETINNKIKKNPFQFRSPMLGTLYIIIILYIDTSNIVVEIRNPKFKYVFMYPVIYQN